MKWIAEAAAVLSAHFETHRRRPKWPFFWRLSLEGLLVPAAILIPLWILLELPTRGDLENLSPVRLVVWTTIVAPFFETLLSQSLPIMIARRFRFGFWTQIIVSIPFFAVPHIPAGIGTVIGAGIFGGFYYGFIYAHWRQESFRSALWMTSGMHAFHNGVLVTAMLLGPSTNEPNKAPEPTAGSVTPRALVRVTELKPQTANRNAVRVAPAPAVAHL